MLDTQGKLAVTAYAIPSILHTFGLFLLITTKFDDEEMTQRLFYIMLSLGELTISVAEMTIWIIYYTHYPVVRYIMNLNTFFAYTLMYEVMIALTVDRFLKIFLNIKYPLYWKYSRTVKLVIALFILNGVMCASFWLTDSLSKLYTYYFLPFDLLFLSVAICTYGYIFVKIQKNRKIQNLEIPQNQLNANVPTTSMPTTSNREKTKKILKQNKQFLSTFLLVISFSSFTVLPDFFYLYNGFTGYWKDWFFLLFTILYSTSYICDFLIYTFSSKPIRRKLKKWVRHVQARRDDTLNYS